jgi:hypothetical protein
MYIKKRKEREKKDESLGEREMLEWEKSLRKGDTRHHKGRHMSPYKWVMSILGNIGETRRTYFVLNIS